MMSQASATPGAIHSLAMSMAMTKREARKESQKPEKASVACRSVRSIPELIRNVVDQALNTHSSGK